jgi:two-component system OmpR family sensor kinase/two-component system sensor histidine kinase BaeS
MSNETSSPQKRQQNREWRFIPFAIILLVVIMCFIGGASAMLFEVFTKSSDVKNSWLLLCGAPFGVVLILFFIIFNLYTRFGKPLQDIFNTIDSVAEGNLSVRVPNDDSPQFGELIKRFNKMVGDLERSDQQRRNLTADIAHELRTPLHIIQGNLEGLMDNVYQPTPEHINNTLEETRLLARLVNDLQMLSLAETGQLPLHPSRFLLADLAADLRSSLSSRAASLGVELVANITDPSQEITADYDRLNQVLSNLISNALRHTPNGGRIVIETGASQDEARRVRIQVRDSGAGIRPEDLPFIFDRFWRGDRARTRGANATSGLGLAIAKQLIDAHDGTITVQSVVGLGSNFIIDLPDRLDYPA